MSQRRATWFLSFFFVACAILLAASSSFTAVGAQGTNLLTNPGFESGTTGWSKNASGNLTFSITNTLTHTGSGAAVLTSLGAGPGQYVYQTLPGITPGATYDLSGYGYVTDSRISVLRLQLSWYSSSDCSSAPIPSQIQSPSVYMPGSFQPLLAPGNVAPPSAQCAVIQLLITPSATPGGSAVFDDISFSMTSTATPTATPSATPTPAKLLIVQVLYDGTQPEEGDEFITILNPNATAVTLDGYKIGDEETQTGSEGMYRFPSGYSLAPNGIAIVARNAAHYRARFGANPTFELATTGVFSDTASIGNLVPYTAWATGSLALANAGDEILLLGPGDQLIDSVAWGSGDFAHAGLTGDAKANEPLALLRYGSQDTNNMTFDFMRGPPIPAGRYTPPALPPPISPAPMPNGMSAFWGDLHAHSTVSDGSGPPRQAFAVSRAAGLHFAAVVDHDDSITTAEWNEMGQAADAATVDNSFVALRGFEFTIPSTGHVTVLETGNWISHQDPAYTSLVQFYAWLAAQPRAIAQFNHPALSNFSHFAVNSRVLDKMLLQEVGNSGDSIYTRYEPAYLASLHEGWRVAPANNSDHHGITWGYDTPHRVGVLAPALTRANLLDALRARRIFSTEDSNLALALQSNSTWMGSTIQAAPTLAFTLTARDPEPEPLSVELYDNGQVVWSQSFPNSNMQVTLRLPGARQHYYFVRATQADGDIAYTAPIWTDNTPLPTSAPAPAIPLPSHENRNDLGNVSIDTARTTELHKRVTVQGCITVPPGMLSDRFLYMQDATAGIRVYLPSRLGSFPALRWAELISVRGTTETRTGEREIELASAGDVTRTGTCSVTPLRLATGGLNASLEGTLVVITGSIVSGDKVDWVISDGSGNADIHLDATSGLRASTFTRGLRYTITGILTHYRNQTVLTPRIRSDVILLQPLLPTATRTLLPRALAPTVTRTPAPAPTVSPVAASETRAFVRPTSEPEQPPPAIQARALATAGGTVFLGTGTIFLILALALFRK